MNLDKLTYFSYLSIKHNLLLPLKKFMSFSDVIDCVQLMNYEKKFFPLPFFLSASETDIKSINNKKLDLFYKENKIGRINVKSISIFKKDLIINFFSKKIKKFSNHPYYDYLKNSKEFIIETSEFNTKRIGNKDKKYFIYL